MKLLVDIGNTRLKAGLADGSSLRSLPAVATSASLDAKLWAGVPDVDAIWIASVASEAVNDSVKRSLHRFGVAPRFVSSSAAACGVRNAYAEPQRLGVDRFLALIAMHAVAENDAVVIASCGTALTLDAMTADGRHLGGLIAPSPALMQSALRHATAKLAEARASTVVDFATDTDTAVTSGTWLAAASLVERFVAQTARGVGSEPRVVVGGGDAQALGGLLGIAHRIEPDLVLRGLSIYATAHR